MPDIPSLTTGRLLLRPWREEDLEPYAAMCADPEVMRYLGSGRPIGRDEAWRQMAVFIGHWALRGYGLWAVEEKAHGSFIGRVGLWQPEGWPGLEIGWALARVHWSQGYATEAASAAMDFAWTQLEASEVISLIQPDNHPSQRVAERLGMELRGGRPLGGTPVLVYRARHP